MLFRSAKVRLVVESNEKKRLFLDFTNDVKEEAQMERKKEKTKVANNATRKTQTTKITPIISGQIKSQSTDSSSEVVKQNAVSSKVEELSQGEDNEDDDDYDDYDEERDIEDSLGLGYY